MSLSHNFARRRRCQCLERNSSNFFFILLAVALLSTEEELETVGIDVVLNEEVKLASVEDDEEVLAVAKVEVKLVPVGDDEEVLMVMVVDLEPSSGRVEVV